MLSTRRSNDLHSQKPRDNGHFVEMLQKHLFIGACGSCRVRWGDTSIRGIPKALCLLGTVMWWLIGDPFAVCSLVRPAEKQEMIHGRFTRKSTEPITKCLTKQSNGWAVIVANVSLVIDMYAIVHGSEGREGKIYICRRRWRIRSRSIKRTVYEFSVLRETALIWNGWMCWWLAGRKRNLLLTFSIESTRKSGHCTLDWEWMESINFD